MKEALRRTVARLVKEQGSATMDVLQPLLPAYTREQIRSALGSAARWGLVHCPVRGRQLGNGRGSLPATYLPGPAPGFRTKPPAIHIRPPNCVWELSHGLQIAGVWPPPCDTGRRYAPLGDWNAEDDTQRSAA